MLPEKGKLFSLNEVILVMNQEHQRNPVAFDCLNCFTWL